MKMFKIILIIVISLFQKVQAQNSFLVLKKKLDAGYYQMMANGTLIFKFNEEYVKQGTTLNYKIYTDKRELLTSCNPSLTGKMGDNRFQLYLPPCGLVNNAIYILEVYNEKNEKWLARFKYVTYIP